MALHPAQLTSRESAYEAAGLYVLDHCDVLLAVWDGQVAQGQGGTGEIVARARKQGKPVIIVRAGNRKPGTQDSTSLGLAQERVIADRCVIPEGWAAEPGR